jgi:hypothetical protein
MPIGQPHGTLLGKWIGGGKTTSGLFQPCGAQPWWSMGSRVHHVGLAAVDHVDRSAARLHDGTPRRVVGLNAAPAALPSDRA